MSERSGDPGDLIVDLARALLELTGRHLMVVLEIPGGHRPLHFEGVLERPFDEAFGPESLTLGFRVDAQHLDLRIADVVEIHITTAPTTLQVSLADGAILKLSDPSERGIR